MNIPSTSGREYLPRYQTGREAGKAASGTRGYSERLEQAAAGRRSSPDIVRNETARYSMQGEDVLLWAPGPGCIFSGGGGGQSAYIEYTADSTPDDPVVRISGRAWSGDYVQTVRLSEIDPRNATYPEMCALLAHQKYLDGGILDNGMSVFKPETEYQYRLPAGIDACDFTQRRDFMALIEKDIAENSESGGVEQADIGKYILDFFERFLEQQDKKAEEEKLDALLGVKDPEEGFWEGRARRQEEYQALRDEQERKERILERLRSGEPVSAAELLLL